MTTTPTQAPGIQPATAAAGDGSMLKRVLDECRQLEADCGPVKPNEFAVRFRRTGIQQCIAVIVKAMDLPPEERPALSLYAAEHHAAPTYTAGNSWQVPPGYVTPVSTGVPPAQAQNVDELEGDDLNYWTALASKRWDEGWLERHRHTDSLPKLSSDWNEGGPLFLELGIDFKYDHDAQQAGENGYCAAVYDYEKAIPGHRGMYELRAQGLGRTPLEASCRALVKSEFGPAVPAKE